MKKILFLRLHLIVIGIITLVAILIANTIWEYRDYPNDLDEANHIVGALELVKPLTAPDLRDLFTAIYEQGFYPPTFSILKGILFALTSPSILVARYFSLFCWLVGLIFVYLVGRELDPKFGPMTGLLAVVLTIPAQPLLVTSAQVMLEPPGLLITYALVWLYIKSRKKNDRLLLIVTSLVLTATFLTKYTYGLPALAALLLLEFWWSIEKKGAKASDFGQRWTLLFGPFLILIMLWFAGEGKIDSFLNYATAQPAENVWDWQTLFFYFHSLIVHYLPAPWMILLIISALFWTFWKNQDQSLLVILSVFFLAGFAEMTLNFPKTPRFIATFVPAANLIVAAFLTNCYDYLGRYRKNLQQVALTVFAVIVVLTASPVLWDRLRAYPALMEIEYETEPQLSYLADWLLNEIPASESFMMVNYWDQFGPNNMKWNRGVLAIRNNTAFDSNQVSGFLLKEPVDQTIANFRNQIGQRAASYVVVFEGAPWGDPLWPEVAEQTYDLLEFYNREIFAIEKIGGSEWLKENRLTPTGINEIKEITHHTLNVQVTIYRIRNP